MARTQLLERKRDRRRGSRATLELGGPSPRLDGVRRRLDAAAAELAEIDELLAGVSRRA